MSARPPLPADDLYARLEVPADASPEAIEVAWRALLRQHHPDVAGPDGLERAKRINVAHDWLSDPVLRGRYDQERGIRRSPSDEGAGVGWSAGRRPATPAPSSRHVPADPARALTWFLDRVAALDADALDRLACAEIPPIAFGATIARFLPADRVEALAAMEAGVRARLDPAAARRPGVLDAVEGFGTELVLGPFLDDLLTEPFRERARERLTRGWDAAVGQPRYGPNGVAVRALLARLAGLDEGAVALLASALSGQAAGAEDPWPPGMTPADDEALRVSSVLAARDAEAAIPAVADPGTTARARRSAARLAHLLVVRHGYSPAAFARLAAPWRPRFLPDEPTGPHVRRPGGGWRPRSGD